ncbi:MAG: transposase [Desulfovibrio sp.]|jgi:transposase|nr:transposase [Desulfovibrio sp.]
MSKRNNHAPEFKANMALAALAGDKTVAGLCAEFGVHHTLIHKWVRQLKESAVGIFSGEIKTEEAMQNKQLHELQAKIAQLTVERDFLAKACGH